MREMVEIFKLSMLEYYIAFAGLQTAFSNRSAAQAAVSDSLYGVRMADTCAGFFCVIEEVEGTRISYALTVPEYRGQGIFTGFLRYLLANTQKPVRLSIASSHPCYDIVRHICEKLGFQAAEQVHVFSCSSEEENQWDTFLEQKGERLCKVLERSGYRAIRFQDLDADLLGQLRTSDRTDYANSFHPSVFLEDPSRKLSRELSYAAVKDHRLAAYSLVLLGDRTSAIFEQISVSAREQGKGVILLPFVYSMKRFFECGLSRAAYAMYGSNTHANAFRKKVLKVFPATESTINNFYYIPPEKKS